MSVYEAKVIRWIDGDTVDLHVNRRHNLFENVRVRLAGVSAPETRGPERLYGLRCLGFVGGLVPEGSTVTLVDWGDSEEDAFGRWLCSLKIADDRDVGAIMIQQGYAIPYEERHGFDWTRLSEHEYPLTHPD
jgi:endonuclease YncB( thermonuclease family)